MPCSRLFMIMKSKPRKARPVYEIVHPALPELKLRTSLQHALLPKLGMRGRCNRRISGLSICLCCRVACQLRKSECRTIDRGGVHCGKTCDDSDPVPGLAFLSYHWRFSSHGACRVVSHHSQSFLRTPMPAHRSHNRSTQRRAGTRLHSYTKLLQGFRTCKAVVAQLLLAPNRAKKLPRVLKSKVQPWACRTARHVGAESCCEISR